MTLAKLWERGKDVLVIAVIPLLMAIGKLAIDNALRDERIADLQEEVEQLDAVKDDLQKANLQMVRLEGKIDAANGRLDEIKLLLRP